MAVGFCFGRGGASGPCANLAGDFGPGQRQEAARRADAAGRKDSIGTLAILPLRGSLTKVQFRGTQTGKSIGFNRYY